MFFLATSVYLRGNLLARLATQCKSLPKSVDLASTCDYLPLLLTRASFNMSLNLIVEAIKKFKQLVEQHCKEPVNGQFEDSGIKEVLPGVETESSSDEEDQSITTE